MSTRVRLGVFDHSLQLLSATVSTDTSSISRLISVTSELEASAIVAALADRGIFAQFVGGYTAGFRAEAPGEVQVLVREEDLARATEIVQEFGDSATEVDWSTVDCGDREPHAAPEGEDALQDDGEIAPLRVSLWTLLVIQTVVCLALAIAQGPRGAIVLAAAFVATMFAWVVFGTVQIVTDRERTHGRLRFLATSLVNVGFVFLAIELIRMLLGAW